MTMKDTHTTPTETGGTKMDQVSSQLNVRQAYEFIINVTNRQGRLLDFNDLFLAYASMGFRNPISKTEFTLLYKAVVETLAEIRGIKQEVA
jgi:hypothetical protein